MSGKEFTDLLVAYIRSRRIQGDQGDGQDFSEKIWTDMKSMFSELGAYLNEKRYDITIQTICTNKELRPAYLGDNLSRLLCMEVGKIFYYMEGLNKKGTAQSTTNEGDRELWNYVRCMIGTVALIKLYGKQCKIKEITEHVSTFMRPLEEALRVGTNRDNCDWVNFEQLKIGTRFLGQVMDEWVTEWRTRQHRITAGNQAPVCTRNRGKEGTDDAGQQAKEGNSIDILDTNNLATATEWMDKREYMKKSDVKELIKKEGGSKNSTEGKNILNTEIDKWQEERKNGPDKATARADMPAEAGGGPNGVQATLPPTTSTSQAPGMSATGNTGTASGAIDPATEATEPAEKLPPGEPPGSGAAKPVAPKPAAPGGSGAVGHGPGQGPGPGQQPPVSPPSSVGTVTDKTKEEPAGKKSTCTKTVTVSQVAAAGRGQSAETIQEDLRGHGSTMISISVPDSSSECSDKGNSVSHELTSELANCVAICLLEY
ncbi:hypothetical protein AK88_05369 [Plasmodium fragile]|uniref:Schizont-infected cell agglutination extracellular alpha domain-containing protein n=1 Tax=Plasmodium fragile TaxID=5857 RepID=A0A0D9QDE5_PLAFR|nr:uncharacterized protein AK88_05369 [Plasmodium fragile]KJP84999.1 hypothetical protein AK88_05369 [Plasmodium fragile]